MLKDFKAFIMRGNVVDMAIGIVIGAAFGRIITSFVNDILMPPLGLLMGDKDFTNYKLILREAVEENGEVVKQAVSINYGDFITTIVSFLIIAFAIFMLIRGMVRMQKKEEEKPAAVAEVPQDIKLLTEIRDALKKP